jgi:hypothetical protein
MLKMTTTFWRHASTLFSEFQLTARSVCGSVLTSLFSINCVSVPPSFMFYLNKLFLRNSHRNKTGSIRSGDRCCLWPYPATHSPKTSCSKAVLVVWAIIPLHWNQQSFWFPSNTEMKWVWRSCVPKLYYQSVYSQSPIQHSSTYYHPSNVPS